MEVIVQHYLLSWNVIIDKKQSWSDTEQNRTDTQSVIWMTSTIMASILKKIIRNSDIVSDWFLSFVYPEVVRKTTTKQRTKQRTNKYKKKQQQRASYIGITLSFWPFVFLSNCLVSVTPSLIDEPILMNLYTVAVDNLRMCMKEDYPPVLNTSFTLIDTSAMF